MNQLLKPLIFFGSSLLDFVLEVILVKFLFLTFLFKKATLTNISGLSGINISKLDNFITLDNYIFNLVYNQCYLPYRLPLFEVLDPNKMHVINMKLFLLETKVLFPFLLLL